MYYLTDFCCLCLECNKNVTSQISISFNARKIMEYVIPESVLQKSEIPIQVCDDCLDNLNNFFKFKQSCLDNVNTFSEYVQKLVAKHGPHNYLSVKTNAISLQNKMCSEIYENVENSEKICDTTIKTEILEDEHDSSSTINTNESNMSLEQVLIKVEDAVDELYVKDEINEELMIKDDLFESDSNAELAPIHDVLRITAPSNTTDQNEVSYSGCANFEDSGSEFEPEDSSSCSDEMENMSECTHSDIHTEDLPIIQNTQNSLPAKESKKVLKNKAKYKKNERNIKKSLEEEYTNSKGDVTPAKKLKVCKRFSENTLCVSDGTITRVLENKNVTCIPSVDKRVKGVQKNRTPDTKITEIINFISRFPSYESQHNTTKRYLAPELNMNIMYSLYKAEVDNPTSKPIFTRIFNTNFNLSFYPSVPESCRKCDSFKVKLKACDDETTKTRLNFDKKCHASEVGYVRDGFIADSGLARENQDICVIAFDLKILPTPFIIRGISYFRRQLWTYCLGVHNMGTRDVFMFIWDETIASCGPEEIGSCLIYFVKNVIKCKKLVIYSNKYGEKNCNINLALICQYIVANPDYIVEQIDHKFLVGGHSDLPCDQDFGLVQKQKKYFGIDVPEHWAKVIVAARKRNPFKVIRMTTELIFSTEKLQLNTISTKIEWLKIRWLQFQKDKPFSIFYKYSNNDHFFEADLSRKNSVLVNELDVLYPDGRAISEKKKKDLLGMVDYIPPILCGYYKNLKTSSLIQKDLLDIPIVSDND